MSMWTEAREKVLRELWTKGLSCSMIAASLGGVTRNAVIGKIHRLKLSDRKTKVRSRSRRQAQAITAKGRSSSKPSFGCASPQTFKAGAFVPEPFVEPTDDQPRQPVKSLMELQPNDCRWHYGDPKQAGSGFCGCEKVSGLPYCSSHSSRAFVAPQPRQRAKEREAA